MELELEYRSRIRIAQVVFKSLCVSTLLCVYSNQFGAGRTVAKRRGDERDPLESSCVFAAVCAYVFVRLGVYALEDCPRVGC